MKPSLACALVVTCCALILSGCTEDPIPPEAPRAVKTITVARLDAAQTLTQTGEIAPHLDTDIGFQIDGRITNRTLDVGAVVKAGDVLATMDSTEVDTALRAAEADLESATSAADLAKITLDRQETLYSKDIVAKARLDEAEANWRAADSRRQAAAAALENAKRRVSFATLRAPSDGVVTAVGANAGQVIAAGQMVVKMAASLEKDAVFFVSERIIHSAPQDIRVGVALVSDPSITTTGRVRDVSPVADQATRTYRVRVALEAPPSQMTFGASVSGTISLPKEQLVVLPASALTAETGAPAVYVVDPATKKLVRKPVAVERYTDREVFVSAGLEAGDVVVTAGVSKLRPDQIVAYPGE